jgi:membrane-associated phospholipid phosphatase
VAAADDLRTAPALTAIAKVFNVLGLVCVALPVRIALAGFLALRRQGWHLAAFAAAIVLSEVVIGSLKGIYNRARSPGSLVVTSGASFPSGHAIAASVTVVAAVIALIPAVAFSIVMGLSRAYLAAHWLSDATAGILLSMSCALVTALIVDQFQRRRNRLQRPAGTQFLAGVRQAHTPRTADDRQESGPHRARHRRPQPVGPADIPEGE